MSEISQTAGTDVDEEEEGGRRNLIRVYSCLSSFRHRATPVLIRCCTSIDRSSSENGIDDDDDGKEEIFSESSLVDGEEDISFAIVWSWVNVMM